jgi:predicted metal-binding membrane protein
VALVGLSGERQLSQHVACESRSHRAFLLVSVLLFVLSAAVTIVSCASMSAMGELPMAGGWTMSMMWMPMCGQTWFDAAASFLGMWIVMMIAMMLPALVPMLWRYRASASGMSEMRLHGLTAMLALGYFLIWIAIGLAAFPVGAALAIAAMEQPKFAQALPMAAGVVVLMAGALQFTAWKARHLACCHKVPMSGETVPADAGAALRYGLNLGLHCSSSCAGLTLILLVVGVMDLRAMAVVTAAITAERLAPAGWRVVSMHGAIAIGAGMFMILRSVGIA